MSQLSKSMGTPLVSVIVPAYNSEESVAGAIESVLAQDYGNIEAIVVDDGSVDGTREIAERFTETGKVRIYGQRNGGPGAARNQGIRVAAGDFIAFLDADDRLATGSIGSRMALVAGVENLELVYSNYFIRRSNGAVETRFGEGYPGPRDCSSLRTPHGLVFEGTPSDIFEIPFDFWTGAVLAGRELIERTGPFRTDIWIGEDRDMWIRLSMNAGRIGYVGTPAAYYHRTKSGLTGRDARRYFKARRELNRGFLEKYGATVGRKKVRKVIREKLAWVHFDLGTHFMRNGKAAAAIGNFLMSIYFSPSNGMPYRSIARTVLPERLRGWLRQAVKPND